MFMDYVDHLLVPQANLLGNLISQGPLKFPCYVSPVSGITEKNTEMWLNWNEHESDLLKDCFFGGIF